MLIASDHSGHAIVSPADMWRETQTARVLEKRVLLQILAVSEKDSGQETLSAVHVLPVAVARVLHCCLRYRCCRSSVMCSETGESLDDQG